MVLALLQYCLNIHGMSLLSWPIIASGQIHAAAIVRAQLRRRVSGLGIGHLGDVHGLPNGSLALMGQTFDDLAQEADLYSFTDGEPIVAA